jgi:casein kinase II subunit beta
MSQFNTSATTTPNQSNINYSSESEESTQDKYWVPDFLTQKGHDYLCEVDDEYMTDRFNLTGIMNEIPQCSKVVALITDQLSDAEYGDEQLNELDSQAKIFYGLVHARYEN